MRVTYEEAGKALQDIAVVIVAVEGDNVGF